ncbi:MAG: hypothetical protein NBV77_04735 [Bacteroidia bacterium]|nr:hypothetical protein [Bacteroidia bacterium]
MAYRKQYLLQGFITNDLALKRSHEMALEAGIPEGNSTKYLAASTQIGINNWALVIDEENLNYLTPAERSSSFFHEIPKPEQFVKFYTPTVYRYMPKKFVDEFFNEGKLKIGSFKKFKQNEDSQKGDRSEGNAYIFGNSGTHSFVSVANYGSDAFVLSTSLLISSELQTLFDSDDCIVITDPVNFAIEVSKKIEHFRGLLVGACRYQPNKTIQRNIPNFDIDSLKVSEMDQSIDMNKLFALSSDVAGDDVFFNKLMIHSPQQEYRFIWFTWDGDVPESIDIICPEAQKYCRRLNELDLNS